MIKNVAKVVVLNQSQEVLLLRRSATDPRRPGEWDFPGGGVDEGETFEAAASRELFEEAGIKVEPSDLQCLYTKTEWYAPGNESVNRFLFLARLGGAATTGVALSYEHDEFVWVSVEQALIDFPHPFYGVGLQYAQEHGLLD